MLEFLKNYYIFMLVLMVFSYLVPKEEYKIYLQFFISIFMIVLLLRPIIEILTVDNSEHLLEVFDQVWVKMEDLELEVGKGENIFEHFFSERER